MKDGKQKRNAILLCIGVICTILAIWTIWGNTALMASGVFISSDRLPSAFSGFRIAHVSDLHNTEFGEGNAALLQLLSEGEPDIIVITGDLIDSHHTDVDIALNFAEGANRIAPTYYVPGNHEAAASQYRTLKAGLESAGVTVLEGDIISLERDGESIALLGLADPEFMIREDPLREIPATVRTKLDALLEQEPDYSLLLSHRPELFETYVACGVDLVLSGHAHGGQFRLPFAGGLIAPHQGLFPKYDAGLYSEGSTNMVVSRGLGNSIIPMRFNNRPEVVFIELENVGILAPPNQGGAFPVLRTGIHN